MKNLTLQIKAIGSPSTLKLQTINFRRVKVQLLIFSVLLALFSFKSQAQTAIDDNGTNVGIGTPAPVVAVGTDTNIRLSVDGGVRTNRKGAQIAQTFTAGSNYNGTNSVTTGHLGYNANWSAASTTLAVNGHATVSNVRASYVPSSAFGGRFIADINAISGSKKHQIGGAYGLLTGNWNGTLTNGFAAAVVGVDEINGSGTFGGYFKGRGYFSDKVGIGTENPTSELHVHDGTIRITGTNFAGGPMILFGENGQTNDNGQWGIEYVPATMSPKPGLNFWRPWPNTNNGNHFLFLSDTGKVAVGTDNTPPSIGGANISAYRFFVKGGILTEEVRVRTGWADYVFADDYNLKPLAEVEAFIKENKHLPNVPSANTVETQGIELGDITRIQQEKIEELTLYAIDQQKQINELKTLVHNLIERK